MKVYHDLRENIKSIAPELLNNKIRSWDRDLFQRVQPFIYEHFWHGNASVNVFRVVGTEHPDYRGMT
jgi:hypothetical protein